MVLLEPAQYTVGFGPTPQGHDMGILTSMSPNVVDTRNRPLRDLRVSVTDRCNFRCRYCMPAEIFNREYEFLSRDFLLTFEEITTLAKAFEQLGVRKIRVTGGEPLLRKGIETLIEMLSTQTETEITLTTNGSLLARKAEALVAAGLDRVTVSLDAIDEEIFQSMNDVGFPAAEVLAGIEAAANAGLEIKVNAVIKRGVNDQDVLAMANHFRGTGHILRFIEYMDVGTSNGWRLDDVVPASELVNRIGEAHPIEPIEPNYRARWPAAGGTLMVPERSGSSRR